MKYLCTTCRSETNGRLRGSGWISFLLLICWIVPGIIYMIWRRTGPRRCTACQSHTLIPMGSPAAKALGGAS